MRYMRELSASWSAYTGYLILVGIPLLLALPSSARVDAQPHWSMIPIFATVAVLLFIIYSLNFGLAHAGRRASPAEIRVSLLAHVGFLMTIGLPYWTVFESISGYSLSRLGGALGYITLYGTCWAFIGLALGRRWTSEITRFNIKYALLIVSIVTTFFVLRPLNPFLMLSLWFGEGSLGEQWGFVLMGYLAVVLVLGVLVRWAPAQAPAENAVSRAL